MRVAHLLRKYDPRAWGGTETAVRGLLHGLGPLGVAAVLYAPRLAEPVDPALDVLARDGCDIRRFRAFVPFLGVSPAAREALIAVGGNLASLDLPFHLLREPGLDVMHTHALGRLGGVARTLARARGIPLVVTIHGGYLDLPAPAREELARPARGGIDYGKAFGLLFGARRVVEDADAVVTVNPREAELLRQRYPRVRVERVPHGVPVARYAEDRRAEAEAYLPILRGRTVILLVGRIDAVKNQVFLVERMPEVLRRFPDALAVLVGPVTDVAHEALVRRRARALGVSDRVLLPGALEPDDPRLVGLYQRADVVVQPSISETFGLALLEAWAAGTAVVASETSGALQVVRHGDNGYLFSLAEPGSFLQALERTLMDRERTRGMIEAGRRLVVEQFDAAAVARRMRGLYAELVEARQTHGKGSHEIRGVAR
jgi:glycosyltransferase involved in cell wall biosynthesis